NRRRSVQLGAGGVHCAIIDSNTRWNSRIAKRIPLLITASNRENESMDITIWVAFAAGLASFISPCCLPLYPSYLSYISGISVSTLKTDRTKEVRMKTLGHT